MRIEIIKGSVVFADVDAIVNASNTYLECGGGVCGAIFESAGKEKLKEECQRLGFCKVGSAVITRGYNLKAKYIIHAVGPIYYGRKEEENLLISAYLESLKIAEEIGISSIAFPCISTGIFGYPLEPATKIAIATALRFKAKNLKVCQFYCYTQEEFDCYIKTYQNLIGGEL